MTTREAIGRAIPIGLLAAGIAMAVAFYVQYRNLPVNALRAQTAIAFDYPVPPGKIIDAISTAYGVYVHFEYPNDPGGEAALLPDMQPSAKVGDSLQSFFDSIEEESEGLLEGVQLGESLCIVPKKRAWTQHRSNLDRIIGVSIEEVSAADALRAIANAVNQYSVEGYPLKLNPGGVRAGYMPPDAFKTEKIPPIYATEITAREAICRVLEHTSYPASWVYGHAPSGAYLTIRFYKDGVLLKRPPASPDEQAYWSRYAEMAPQK